MNILISDLVSVIIPVFNQEKYLDRCLSSVLRQDYKQIELVIVDDGSTDSSHAIIDKWRTEDNRIRSFYKCNGGLSDARNYGIDKVKGEYIMFVDSDDWLEPDMVSTMLNALKKESADMSVCNYYLNYIDGREDIYNKDTGKYMLLNRKEAAEQLLQDNLITNHAWRRMYKTELVPKNVFPEGHNYEDAFAVPALTLNCEHTVYLGRALYHYFNNPRGISATFTFENKLDYLQSFEHSFEIFEKEYPELEKEIALSREQHAMVAWINYFTVNLKDCEDDFILNRILEMTDKVPAEYINIRMRLVNHIIKKKPPKKICRYIYRLFVTGRSMD